MIDKQARLEKLQIRGGQVPATFWSLEEFTAEPRDQDALWWVRPTASEAQVRHSYEQRPVAAGEVAALAHALPPENRASAMFVVQAYIAPAYSGVTYTAGSWSITEGVVGPCSFLLRHGASGRLLMESEDASWETTEHDGVQSELLARAGASIRKLGRGVIVEWVVSERGDVYHVDLKEVGLNYFREAPLPPPTDFLVGRGSAAVSVRSTDLQHLGQGLEIGGLRCAEGSPLAHLCVEMYMAGKWVSVRRQTEGLSIAR